MLGVWDTKEYAAIISNVGCGFFNSSLQILDSDFRIITIRYDWRNSHHFRILISKINEQLDPHYRILDLKKKILIDCAIAFFCGQKMHINGTYHP